MINNDNLLIALGSVILYLLVKWNDAHGLQSVVTAVIASVVWSPWAARNLSLYGDLTAEKVANIPVLVR